MTVEFAVKSEHLTSRVMHELLFSVRKKKFVKPVLSDEGKLIYRLRPGVYVKFSLHAWKNNDYAVFSISYVRVYHVVVIEEKPVFKIELSYTAFKEIALEIGAPYVLKEFVRMLPEYHKVAKVDESNYPEDKDVKQIIDEIKAYLEKKVVSV